MTNEWRPHEGRQTEVLLISPDDAFEILYGGARGGGKAQPITAKVLTPKGFVNIGSLKIGDIIYGAIGSKETVEGIFPQGRKRIYEIKTIDGAKTRCTFDHLWKVHFTSTKRKNGIYSLSEIKEILEKTKNIRATIPLYEPPRYPQKKLPIDPYLLGVLLGDGYLNKRNVRISSADDFILKKIEKLGFSISKVGKYDYSLIDPLKPLRDNKGKYVSNQNSLLSQLRRLGLAGKTSHKKFIPLIYYESSTEQLWELLRGLMDTDGTADTRGHINYSSVSKELAKNVQDIVWKLGGKATLKRKNRKSGLSYHIEINFNNNENCFYLPRKKERVKNKRYNGGNSYFGRRIVKICDTGKKEESVCIKVSHSLYITDDYIVTHNTEAGQAWLLYDHEHPFYRALVIRRNADDLRDWIDRAKSFYSGYGEVVGNPPEVRFYHGGIIRTGHLADDNAYTKYQGHGYHRILIEELTHIPSEDLYKKLITSCRTKILELKPQIMANANPDGPGFSWVKKRWNLYGIPYSPIWTTDPDTNLKRVFIPARVQDNPSLIKNDPNYVAMLNGLPDGLREAWRDGSWEEPVITGAYYTMALMQARKEKRIKNFAYDPSLRVHTVWDLGIGEQLVCGFFQKVSGELRLIDIWQGKESDGIPQAVKLLQTKEYIYGKHFAPHDVNKTETSTGKTILDVARGLGIRFTPVPNMGIAHGIQKALILFPRLYINEQKCEQFLSAIRQYRKQWDEKRLDWKEEPIKDWTNHYADVLRYTALIEDKITNEKPQELSDEEVSSMVNVY